jgi:hypothetical protein
MNPETVRSAPGDDMGGLLSIGKRLVIFQIAYGQEA